MLLVRLFYSKKSETEAGICAAWAPSTVQERHKRKTRGISVKCLLTGPVLSVHNCELYLNQKGNCAVGWCLFYRLSVSRTCSVLVGKFPLSPPLSTDLICKPNKLKFQTPGYTAAKRDWFIAIFMGYESIIPNSIHSVPALKLLCHSEDRARRRGSENPLRLR